MRNLHPLQLELDECRKNILQNHGGYFEKELNEMVFPKENIDIVTSEIQTLWNISQEISIECLSIQDLKLPNISASEMINFRYLIIPEESDAFTTSMTNEKIFTLASQLQQSSCLDIEFPSKISFYLMINKTLLFQHAAEIEEQYLQILNHYGSYLPEEKSYMIDAQYREEAQLHLTDLMSQVRSVKLYMCDINDFNISNICTQKQFQDFAFMINEIKENYNNEND